MIVPPKKYIQDGHVQLGGYLLNDVVYTESLFIDNPSLVDKTQLTKDNIIYNMVDNINSVAFQINCEVLDFILNNFKELNLIIDPDYIHPLELKSKLNSEEEKKLEQH